MIYEALYLLRTELRNYLHDNRDTNAVVELGNVAKGSDGHVLVSLVNVEEEAALRNSSPYRRNETTGGFEVSNPPVFLNLYVLIAAYSTSVETYSAALQRLGWVLECFQQKNTYSAATTPGAGLDASAAGLRITLDLHSLSLEKVNQLWGTLGDNQVPCVLYKVRVVEEKGAAAANQSPEISSLQQPPAQTTSSAQSSSTASA